MNEDLLFVVVTWPESQMLMDKEGFDENCFLINDERGMDEFGSSAFFCRVSWLNK